MSDKIESVIDLVYIIEWEGGVEETIFGYGLTSDQLPEGTPAGIVDAWRKLEGMRDSVVAIEAWLEEVG